jgi:hypothetical protein
MAQVERMLASEPADVRQPAFHRQPDVASSSVRRERLAQLLGGPRDSPALG